jgi:hypothetical protein
MDISAVSTALSQINTSQSAGIQVLKMVKDESVQQGQELVQMMQQSVQPNLGRNIDLRT